MAHSAADPIAAVFDGEHDGRPSPELTQGALDALLERHPDAPVAALSEDGLIVPMPESVPLRDNQILEGRSGLDLVVFDEESVAGWDRILTHGAAAYRVYPAGHPDAAWQLYGLDLRATHGIVFTLSVPLPTDAGGSQQPAAPTDPTKEFVARPPRCATVRKDARAMILSVDAAASQLLGWAPEDMVGQRSTHFIHPDDQTLTHDAWMEMLAAPGPGRRLRVRHRCADGSWLWTEIANHNLLADPEYECVLCEMVDISEEMAVHELLNRLAEAVPVGLLQLDTRGHVVYSNDRLHEILGVQRMDTMRAQLSSLAPAHRGMLCDAIETVLADGRPTDLETELRHPATRESRFCTVGVRALNDGKRGISGAIVCVSDITDSIHMREELRRRSTYDELTGCLNRTTIMGALRDHLADLGSAHGCAVVFVDLDCFKPINDRYGHAAGDELLRVVAKRLRGALRGGDAIGRLGGDEFLIVSPNVPSAPDALALAERIAAVQKSEVRLAGTKLHVRFSIGVAWTPANRHDADTVVACADEAMYQSKRERLGRPKLGDPALAQTDTDADGPRGAREARGERKPRRRRRRAPRKAGAARSNPAP